MLDAVVLPPAFVQYVTRTGMLPLLATTDVAMVADLIELICLEQAADGDLAP